MKTEIGTPKMFGEAVGRIVGFSDKGQVWIENGTTEISTILIWATPGGSVIETGRFRLKDMPPAELEKLYRYEKMARVAGQPLYASKIKI